jgi:DNA-directed RNA polymerase specialized sigma24 family protein
MLDPAGRDSFESFFREHYASLVRALVVVSGGEAEAQDLAQEAFARARSSDGAVSMRWSRPWATCIAAC